MKLASFSLALLTVASRVTAQYFSDGWAPGKPVTQDPPPAATLIARAGEQQPQQPPAARTDTRSAFDLSRLLESAPVANLFSKVGINISEQIAAAQAKIDTWDPRIPLITDDNYDHLIVNEPLTPEEKEKRLWFLVITGQSTARSSMSKSLDESFDSAYNTTVIEGDLSDVRWGRIDYLNVTYLTTKWNVWQAPYILVIRNQGQDLYFYQANHVRLTPDIIRNFLVDEIWKQTNPWRTPLSPGGDYEYVLHYFALSLKYLYNWMVILPRWVLMIISGGIASLIMRLMHRNPEAEASQPAENAEEKPETTAPAITSPNKGVSTTASTPSKSKGRKGGKK